MIPEDGKSAEVTYQGLTVQLSNLDKPFWPTITKRDLLRYYEAIAPVLLPHLQDRAMVMKRYPNGAAEKFFFMKRTPENHPEWLRTCAITHGSGNINRFSRNRQYCEPPLGCQSRLHRLKPVVCAV